MIYRCRRQNRKYSRLFKYIRRSVIVFIAFNLGLIFLCESKLETFVPEYVRTQAELMSSTAVNDAVQHTLEAFDCTYNDLAVIKYSDSGSIKAIETDTLLLDKIKIATSKAAQNEIEKIHDCGVNIPLGAFTDIAILSNSGPDININTSITGSFNSEVVSTFEQAGLNQTVHHIKLVLTSKIITTSLDYVGYITFTTDYEIAQTVIVGEIPSSYGNLYQTQN